jgi:hypothetical protein
MVSRPGGWVPATLMTPSRSYPPHSPVCVGLASSYEGGDRLGELIFVGVAA